MKKEINYEKIYIKTYQYRTFKKYQLLFEIYISDIDQKHCVYTLPEATFFETRKRAEQIKKKFKHPDLWEVKVIEK